MVLPFFSRHGLNEEARAPAGGVVVAAHYATRIIADFRCR